MSPRPWQSACLDGVLLPGCSPSPLAVSLPSKVEGKEEKARRRPSLLQTVCHSKKNHTSRPLSMPSIFGSLHWSRLLLVRVKFE